jgi:hypothetical protein
VSVFKALRWRSSCKEVVAMRHTLALLGLLVGLGSANAAETTKPSRPQADEMSQHKALLRTFKYSSTERTKPARPTEMDKIRNSFLTSPYASTTKARR